MESIILEEKNVFEYIYDNISGIRLCGKEVENARYHHNTTYNDAVSICRYGILTLLDLNKYGIRTVSEDFLKLMSDIESHVNGNNCVSLSVVGLDDIYPNEDEYNPFIPSHVDFLVTSDIKAGRSSIHYGNEFLSHSSIKKEELRAIDIRLLKLMELQDIYRNESSAESILKKYNHLKNIALEIKKQNLDIPLREMSENSIFELDLNKLVNQPKLVLKKPK